MLQGAEILPGTEKQEDLSFKWDGFPWMLGACEKSKRCWSTLSAKNCTITILS